MNSSQPQTIEMTINSLSLHFESVLEMFGDWKVLCFFILFGVMVYVIKKFIWNPYTQMNEYKQLFQKAGYNPYVIPFKAFRFPIQEMTKENEKKFGDALYHQKTIYTNYDVVISNCFNRVVLELVHPELIKNYYKQEKQLIYPKYELIKSIISRAIGTTGLVFSEGELWKKKRRITTSLMTFDMIKNLTPKIYSISQNVMQKKENQAKASQKYHQQSSSYQYNLMDMTVQVFADVVIECFFGGESTNEKVKGKSLSVFVKKIIDEILIQSKEPLSIILGAKYLELGVNARDRKISQDLQIFNRWSLEFLKKRLTEIMEQKKKIDQATNMLEAMMLSGQIKKDEKLSSDQLKSIIQDFKALFVAGSDTTAHFVVMMLYYIVENPSIEKRVRQQIEQHISSDGEPYSFENLKKLTLIDKVQKETTRMYGPITEVVLREATRDNYFGEVNIKTGTLVTPKYLALHYNPKNFENPNVFNPDRWTENEFDTAKPFTYSGFSGGARSCVGKQLAYLESKILLVMILKRYSSFEVNYPIRFAYESVYTPVEQQIKLKAAKS